MNENDQAHSKELTEEDFENWANQVAPWSHLSKLSLTERKNLAKQFGSNWACILSGCGDQ